MTETTLYQNHIINLSRKAGKLKIPVTAQIELTYGCNLNCVHCYNPTHQARGEMKIAEITSIIDQLADMGTQVITFTGGEMFSRKDVFDILEYTRIKKGLLFIVMTNATLFTEERVLRLKELAPQLVDISMYGATRKTYERVTRKPGSFAKFLNGVRLLKAHGLNVNLKAVVLNLNLHEIEKMRHLSHQLRIKFVYSTDVRPRVDGSREPLQYRISHKEELKLEKQYIFDPLLEKGWNPKQEMECNRTDFLLKHPVECLCGKSNVVITPYGKMNLCTLFYYPQKDVLQTPVAKSWGCLVDYVRRLKPTKAFECPTCPVGEFCSRSSADSWLEMGDVNACVPYLKEKASARKRYLEKLCEEGKETV